MIIAPVLAAVLQTVGPTAAGAPAPLASPPPAARGGPVKDVKVCRTLYRLGRHIGESECMLKSEWAEYDRAVAKAHARNSDMGGGQGACLPDQPCRNGPGGS